MSRYAHPEVLVDTQWLMDHLNDPMVRVVEVDMSQNPTKMLIFLVQFSGISLRICSCPTSA